jgi:hypothetical protein
MLSPPPTPLLLSVVDDFGLPLLLKVDKKEYCEVEESAVGDGDDVQ